MFYYLLQSQKLEAPDDFEGGVTRRCTDVLFFLVIIVAWAAMTYLGVDAIVKGDPDILLNGIDYKGRVCGVDDAVKDKPEVREERTCCQSGR